MLVVNSKYLTCFCCFHKSYGVACMNPYFIDLSRIHRNLRIQAIKLEFFGTSLWQNPPTILVWIIVYFPNQNIFSQFKIRLGEREVTWTIVRFLYQVCITMRILVNFSFSSTNWSCFLGLLLPNNSWQENDL